MICFTHRHHQVDLWAVFQTQTIYCSYSTFLHNITVAYATEGVIGSLHCSKRWSVLHVPFILKKKHFSRPLQSPTRWCQRLSGWHGWGGLPALGPGLWARGTAPRLKTGLSCIRGYVYIYYQKQFHWWHLWNEIINIIHIWPLLPHVNTQHKLY